MDNNFWTVSRWLQFKILIPLFLYRKEKKSRTLEERGSKGEDSHYLNRLEEVKHENFNLSAFLNYIEKTDGKPPANLITANMYEQLTECKFNQVFLVKT